ncbi:unnamed protein product, partial [Callosobruchus maculatus]
IPETIDWRKRGAVTGVKDHGLCGSSWAFASTGHLEGQLAIKFKQYISLSAQNLVDCSKENSGCNGGNMLEAYDYVRQFGIESEGDYPYEKRRRICRADNEHIVTKVSGILRIHPSKDEVQKAR